MAGPSLHSWWLKMQTYQGVMFSNPNPLSIVVVVVVVVVVLFCSAFYRCTAGFRTNSEHKVIIYAKELESFTRHLTLMNQLS